MAAVINPLLENGLIEIDEKVTERYRPKKTTVVRITFERGDTERLHECFGMVSRSRQQEKLLIAYLDLSAWLSPGGELKEVERDKLLSTAGTSPAVLRSLIDKGILETVKKSVNRFASAGTPDNAINLSPLSESQKKSARRIRLRLPPPAYTAASRSDRKRKNRDLYPSHGPLA